MVRKDRKLGLGGETKEDSRKKAKEAKDFQILCNTIDVKLEKQILNEVSNIPRFRRIFS